MGYRSQVFYGASFPTDDEANAAMMAAKLKFDFGDKHDNEWFWDDHCEVSNNRIIFMHDSIKWYTSYDSIVNIINMFTWFNEELGAYVRFLRVGEEPEDIENNYWGGHPIEDEYQDDVLEYEVYTQTTIVTPWGSL
jgi:hypothetical protein